MTASTALMTDKYELTMLAACIKDGTADKKAVFEGFARRLPPGRKYGVMAGARRIREAVEAFVFTPEQIDFLHADGLDADTLDYLESFRFTGSIRTYADGELYFPYSPVVSVEATFGEAVLLETVILSILNHDCAIASAASRIATVANGKPVQELGARRTHESAAVAAAYSAYIAGFSGTSNLEAGKKYDIPVFGTAAHAFTLAHADEKKAFASQVAALGTGTTLLVDTYDIEQGIRNAIEVAGTGLGAIRIDSGDLYEEVVNARVLLDSLGAFGTKIVVSSDIDEFVIDEMMSDERGPAPVDAFGVGTRVVTGSGHPTASMVYKLVAIEEEDGTMRPVAKASSGKISIGGAKDAYRIVNKNTGLARAELVVPKGHDVRSLLAEDETAYRVLVPLDSYSESIASARKRHPMAVAELGAYGRTMESGKVAIPTINHENVTL